MTSRCSSSTCLNGNCQGCKNGSKYCNDPRCYPNCPDCSGETSLNCVSKRDAWDWTLIITITVLSIIVLILIGLLAWGWYDTPEEMMGDYAQYYPDQYQQNQQNHQYHQHQQQGPGHHGYVNNPAPPAYNQAIDASLNVPVGIGGQAPPGNVIPGVPPSNLSGPASVASAQPPSIPSRSVGLNDGVIRGFE